MTCQVAIMNTSAVALAADSAVSIRTRERGRKSHKIYNTKNKLFSLSCSAPVGIMVHGNANYMHVPWEVIIKLYRSNLNTSTFSTLEEYGVDFVRFLDKNVDLIPKGDQKRFFCGGVRSIFSDIRKQVDEKVKTELKKKGRVSDARVNDLLKTVVIELHDNMKRMDNTRGISETDYRNLKAKYGKEITKVMREVLNKYQISKATLSMLGRIALWFFYKESFFDQLNNTGVVIAGYGDKEIFPHLVEYIIGFNVDRLQYMQKQTAAVSLRRTGIIVPFAQRRMVDTFMTGIHPFHSEFLSAYLTSLLEEYPNVIIDDVMKIKGSRRLKYKKLMKNTSKEFLKLFRSKMDANIEDEFILPITSAVAELPKDELVLMAESLVNLIALRQKMSIKAEETVGPPIDVAIISKGDGFVWIKRKKFCEVGPAGQFEECR